MLSEAEYLREYVAVCKEFLDSAGSYKPVKPIIDKLKALNQKCAGASFTKFTSLLDEGDARVSYSDRKCDDKGNIIWDSPDDDAKAWLPSRWSEC